MAGTAGRLVLLFHEGLIIRPRVAEFLINRALQQWLNPHVALDRIGAKICAERRILATGSSLNAIAASVAWNTVCVCKSTHPMGFHIVCGGGRRRQRLGDIYAFNSHRRVIRRSSGCLVCQDAGLVSGAPSSLVISGPTAPHESSITHQLA